jgi:predicted short-subunit dehydrogenase-like oxidoreductase (DUF2520 family)
MTEHTHDHEHDGKARDHDHDHDHGAADHDHWDPAQAGHRHPHPPNDPSGLPRIGIVGAGHVGTALGIAFNDAGWPVGAVASRSPERREAFVRRVPRASAFDHPQNLVEDVDLVFLTVPDDAIERVAGQIRLYGGQSIVHTSGALTSAALAPARAAGTTAASFHPLVAFADVDRGVAALHGSTIALEGDEQLLGLLARLATDIGAQPVRLPPTGKAAYHAAAVLSAGGFVGLLDAIAELGRGAGLDERGALAIFAPLIRQTLANAEALGIRDALTGPLLRGDVGTVRDHLDAMRRLAPGATELYVAAARREIALAEARGAVSADTAELLRDALLGR